MRISDWSSDVCSSDLDERRNILHLSMSATDKHSTALHEVEHAIQKIEDMGRGADPDSALRRMSAAHLPDTSRNVIGWEDRMSIRLTPSPYYPARKTSSARHQNTKCAPHHNPHPF